MSFTDMVQHKIAERRVEPSPRVLAKAERDKRFRALGAPVINALEGMRDRLAKFVVTADLKRDRLTFRLYPKSPMTSALNAPVTGYSSENGLKGRSKDLNAFITLIEDHIADFIADVATTPAAALLSQSSATTKTDFDSLTRY